MVSARTLYQGDEDSLCGPYSVVNSLRLLWPHEMDANTTSAVFKAVAHSLDRWPSILWEGTHYGDMPTMLMAAQCHLATRALHFIWNRPFRQGAINHIEVFETNLRHELDCPGTAAVVCMDVGPWLHWSVVDRFTKHHMVMTDSGATKPIHLSNCGLRTGRTPVSEHTFVFDYPRTFVVRRVT